MAHSKYICFFDADDKLEKKCYEKLLDCINNNNADMAIIDFAVVHPDGNIIKKRKNIKKLYNNNSEIVKDFLSGKHIFNNIFDKIYTKNIIGDIKFIEGKSIGEDMYFNFQVLMRAKRVYIDTSEVGYYYYKRNGSAMNSSFSDKYLDTIILSDMITNELRENRILSKYAEAHKIHEICKFLEYMILNNADESYNKFFNKYMKIIKKYNVVKAYKYLSKKQFCGLLLMKCSPKTYIKIFKLLKIG